MVDPLERYDAVILFKTPESFHASSLKHGKYATGFTPEAAALASFRAWYFYYLLCLHRMNPEGRKVFMGWESFVAAPERHLKRISELLDLPYDPAILKERRAGQHIFGGNGRVADEYKARPTDVDVQPEPTIRPVDIEDAPLAQAARKLWEDMMARYRQDFGDISDENGAAIRG